LTPARSEAMMVGMKYLSAALFIASLLYVAHADAWGNEPKCTTTCRTDSGGHVVCKTVCR
jgi:hypothetical protein